MSVWTIDLTKLAKFPLQAQALSKSGSHDKAKGVLEEVVKTAIPSTEVLIILANVYGNLNEHHKVKWALATRVIWRQTIFYFIIAVLWGGERRLVAT